MEKKNLWKLYSPFVKGNQINLGKKRTQESKDKIRGQGNPNWKGDSVLIHSLHTWINRNWGTERKCETCGTTTAKKYDWSSTNHDYTRERQDWKRLCRSCHMKHDYWNNNRRNPRGATLNANQRVPKKRIK